MTLPCMYCNVNTLYISLLSAGAVLCHDFSFEQLSLVADLQDNEALQAIDEALTVLEG